MSGTGPPLPGGEGLGGTGTPPGAPAGTEGVGGYRPLEGAEQAAHTERLARALRETWESGQGLVPGTLELDWLRFAHWVEQRLGGLSGGEPGPAEPFAQVTGPVDTA